MCQHEKVYALRALKQVISALSTKEVTTEKKIDVRGGAAGQEVRRRAGVERRKQGPMLQKIEQQDPRRARRLEPLGIKALEQHCRRQSTLGGLPLCASPIASGVEILSTVWKTTTFSFCFFFFFLNLGAGLEKMFKLPLSGHKILA